MDIVDFLIFLAVVWIIGAIVSDFKNREVPNWLNFSLIAFALSARFFYSIFSNDYRFILYGLIGFGIFFVIANIFYYARFFAGGDAKLLMSLGAIIPFSVDWYESLLIGFVFLILLLVAGVFYSLIYSGTLSFIHRKKFAKDFIDRAKKNKIYFLIGVSFLILFSLVSIIFQDFLLLVFGGLVFIFPILYVYVKSVEQSCMIIRKSPGRLSVGDWLAKEINVGGRKIKPSWEGLSEREIKLIQKHCKNDVLIKDGIPFTPSFLIAFGGLIYIKYFFGSNWGLWNLF